MKLMVIGGGGREHAIIRKLKENPAVEVIYALPGNGGMKDDAVCVPEIGAVDIPAQVEFARSHGIDYAVVTPDDPLALGAVDALSAAGIPCFGPERRAAVIESSKVFSKALMKKYGIPTAGFEAFDSLEEALGYLEKARMPIVIKADGLALGKGVVIAQTRKEAKAAVRSMMEEKVFGTSGDRVVIEEYLEGPEVSVLSFTDGETVVPMISSMDHKRSGDNDTGLNTGGMGAVAPNPYYTEAVAKECMETIFLPTVRAMKAEGRPFRGCLYFGLMLTADGPKVIEYNCRFGDPETQVVLPLLKTDLLTAMKATTDGTLTAAEIAFSDQHACCVVLASAGYPKKYEKGLPMTMTDEARAHAYTAGVKQEKDRLLTNGGRVVGVTAVADTLPMAISEAYRLAEGISFANKYCRHDIGQRALAARKEAK